MTEQEQWDMIKDFNERVKIIFTKEEIEAMGLNPKRYGYR